MHLASLEKTDSSIHRKRKRLLSSGGNKHSDVDTRSNSCSDDSSHETEHVSPHKKHRGMKFLIFKECLSLYVCVKYIQDYIHSLESPQQSPKFTTEVRRAHVHHHFVGCYKCLY